jgi:leader peptidase (prepilin peptidase)/N-methyltransferase
MIWFSILLFALLGAALGSFTTALIHRIKNNQSWIVAKDKSAARSACPQCNHTLSALDLVPIFSWVFLHGRCRYCGGAIPAQYVLIEMVSVFAAVVIFLTALTTITMIFLLLMLPFLLAQIILFLQNKFISAQLWFIIGGIVASYLILSWT